MQKLENAFMLKDDEAVQIIHDAFGIHLDSIGATQELGSEGYYVTKVDGESLDSFEELKDSYHALDYMGCTGAFLDLLCKEGLIEPGTYIIDCTW